MKIAFLFPGQGAQYKAMGKDLYEKYPKARQVFDQASQISKMDLKTLCFEEELETLSQTQNAQIAIATVSLAIAEIVKERNILPEVTVGLSLGEYAALTVGEKISFEDAIKLLKKRGQYMGSLVEKGNYAMLAIIGLTSEKIEEICSQYQKKGDFAVPANYNYSLQTVIAVDTDIIEPITEDLKQVGARKVVTLQTSGPFHTVKLEKASKAFEEELKKIHFKQGNSKIKVLKNLDGNIYTQQDDMTTILSKHIVSPVRFDQCIEQMKEMGIDTFIEIGPGKALTGFVKKELKEVTTFSIYDGESLENVVTMLEKYKK